MSLTYRKILHEDDIDIPYLASMYQVPQIAQFLSVGDNYFHYVTNTENVYFYKVYENDNLVGSTHLEKQGNVLFMDILIFPKFQGLGLGTKIVKDIQKDIFGLDFERIEISIDERNTASLRLFENAGFVRTSKNGELIDFRLSKKIKLIN